MSKYAVLLLITGSFLVTVMAFPIDSYGNYFDQFDSQQKERVPSLWETIQQDSRFQTASYKERIESRIRYFDQEFTGHHDYVALPKAKKLQACTDWLSEELNGKDFADWKKRNKKLQKKYAEIEKKIQKKRRKCNTKAAEKAGTEGGLGILLRDCYWEYPSPELETYSKQNYTLSNKDLVEITALCDDKVSTYYRDRNRPTPLELVNNPNLVKHTEYPIKEPQTTAPIKNSTFTRNQFENYYLNECVEAAQWRMSKQQGYKHCACRAFVMAKYVDLAIYNQTRKLKTYPGYLQELKNECNQ